MTAKDYLLRYKLMTTKIATAESELSALRAASEGISSKIDGMPKGSGSRDRLAKLAVQIADREVELTELKTGFTMTVTFDQETTPEISIEQSHFMRNVVEVLYD